MPPAKSTDAALMAAILAAPDDDLPRLVYADWCDENGEPDRAEFIRTEIEMAKMMPDWGTAPNEMEQPQFRPLERRAGELWDAHHEEWFPGLVRTAEESETFRGFPIHIAVSARRFVKHSADWFRVAPTIDDVIINKLGKNASELAKCPAFEYVKRLSFFETPFRRPEAEAFFRCEHLHCMKVLDLGFSDTQMGPDGAEALAGCPSLVNLEELDVHNHAIYDAGVAAILGETKFRTLRAIDFGNNGLSSSVAEDFIIARHLDQLRELDLSWNHLSAMGVADLCGVPHLGGLEVLKLNSNPLGPDAASPLVRSTFAGRLTNLGLYGCRLGDEGLAELLGGRFPRLKDLGVGGDSLGTAAVEALASNDGLSAVESLSLGQVAHGVTGRLAAVRTLPALRFLSISHQPWVAIRLAALVEGELLRPVATLNIAYAGIDGVGARTLAAADLPNLRTLNLDDNGITDAGARALVEAKGLAGLTHLALGHNSLTERGKGLVKERFGSRCRV